MGFKKYVLRFWNFWPPFFGVGIKIQKVTEDYRYMKIRLKLRFWNSNYVGTQYGGSMFSMTDPFYMVMLLRNLGSNYIVWDKSASIRYIKPGKTDVFAEFKLTQEILDDIIQKVNEQGKIDWVTEIDILDKNNELIAKVEKTLYIRKKNS